MTGDARINQLKVYKKLEITGGLMCGCQRE
jgi:hypothetical protein